MYVKVCLYSRSDDLYTFCLLLLSYGFSLIGIKLLDLKIIINYKKFCLAFEFRIQKKKSWRNYVYSETLFQIVSDSIKEPHYKLKKRFLTVPCRNLLISLPCSFIFFAH